MIRRLCFLSVLMVCGVAIGQTLSQDEQLALQKAIAEAGNSPSEFALALENHLKRYPNSPKRADIERALVKTAMDLNDDARLIKYGESVLAQNPDDTQLLQHLTTALLHQGGKPDADRALEHARHLAAVIQSTYQNDTFEPGGGAVEAKRKEDFDRSRASALLLESRATGLLGNTKDATDLAESSYKVFPSVEAAREAARWLTAAGKDQDALEYFADAFAIGGLHSADSDAAGERARMGELYRKLHGTDAGLGDLILKAYDSTSSQLAARRAEMRAFDPNAQAKSPMQFTLSGLDGDKLQLSSLLGKVVVIDFWATWCVPCRAQHPLYNEVKAKFKDRNDVVFLAVDTDEDHTLVKPFLKQVNWNQNVYFEDGLQRLLEVSSIPTTVILGKNGDIFTRMVGFLPDRFVDMLTDRVTQALKGPQNSQPSIPPLSPVTHQ